MSWKTSNCKTCGKRHSGRCRFDNSVVCSYCNRQGHDVTNCKTKNVVCYNCKETGHYSSDCPKGTGNFGNKVQTTGASGSGAKSEAKKGNARVLVLNTKQTADLIDAITGTFLVNNIYARVLVDSEMNLSFI